MSKTEKTKNDMSLLDMSKNGIKQYFIIKTGTFYSVVSYTIFAKYSNILYSIFTYSIFNIE